MKKTILLVLLGMGLAASASPVDPATARTVAVNFLQIVSKQPVGELTDITAQTPWHEFYIFNIGNGSEDLQGFVIVAADDCVIPILAYSLENRFDTDNMPPNLMNWLQGYEDQIAWWRQQAASDRHPASDPNAPLQDWGRLHSISPVSTTDDDVVGPLLTTTWDQNDPYNDSCPPRIAPTATGCDATAVAQIMKKWNHPTTGYGSHSYQRNTLYGTQSANFGNTTYNWSNMPNALTSSSLNSEIEAVATLMYHIGVAIEMDYGIPLVGSSAAYSWNPNYSIFDVSSENALRLYFKYSSTLHQIRKVDYNDYQWKAMLRNELDNGRPILYRGEDDNNQSGHAFVCDGYSSATGQFWFNWGWGGTSNGWYTIGNLNPQQDNYNTNNIATIGIEPNYNFGGSTTVTATSNNSNYGTCVIHATSDPNNTNTTGSGTYSFGDTISVWAMAQSGMRFKGWSDGYKYNPREFIATGGNVNITAQFEPLSGDTISYCAENITHWKVGDADGTTYWGIEFPQSIMPAGKSLHKVQMYAVEAGTYTLSVYYGGTNDANIVYTQTFAVSSSEINTWKTVTLPTPYDIDGTGDMYLTFQNSDASSPAAYTYYSGNNHGILWGSNYSMVGECWMIRGIFSSLLYQDETVSYCGDAPSLNQYGMDDGTSWGISFSPVQLADRNGLQSVLLYTPAAGNYTLNVFSGNETNPTTLLYTNQYNITDATAGYKEMELTSPVVIDHTQHLWVTFHNTDVASPAAVCRYNGDPRSRWFLFNSNWVPMNEVAPTLDFSWMIKIVTTNNLPFNNSITVSACGSYEWNGTTYTESGDYTHSYTDDNGFAHSDTLHLTINNSVHTATEITASSMYTWNGTDYYFTGDYTYSHPNANGCTQVDTLHLTISNPQDNILEYWFDQQYANRTVATLGSTTWQTQINVGSLDVGLHSLHMHLRNSEGRCSPPRTALFYKMIEANAAGIPNMDYTFWFDQDFASQQTIPYAQGGSLIDVSQLSDGLHTFNVIIGSGMATDLHSHIFYKMPYVGASGFNYTCWFDQNYGNRHSGSITGGAMLLDAGNLTVGLHTLNMQIGSGASAQLHSQLFYYATRTAALADTSTLLYSYAIDGQTRPTLHVSPQNRLIHLDLDVANIGAGLHSLYGWLSTADGTAMSQHSAWFYAQPEGGIGISRYEYWFNDDYDNRTEVAVTPVVDSLRLITLLQVDTLPINSNNFQFDPNGGAPIIYSRNSISFRFWNSVMRWSSVTRQYVDQRVVETVLADTIERNTTKTIATPGTGQIHWFKLAAGPGDSLSFRTNRRGTMQLYAPSGAMILHASTDSVLAWNSCRVWENGVYYLAVHDVEGGGNTDVSYLYYINQSCLSTATVAACESYTWNGVTYTESGTYIYRTIGSSGCDSVAILYLTVNTPVHTATTEVACDSFTWNGTTYTSDGDYTYSHPDANGCTQVDTLHLTINHSTAVTIYDTADATYTWHGTTYTTSGTYQWHGTNASGCDSTETLLLVIIPVGIDTPDGDENIVEIYPNPTTGLLTINANGVTLVEVIDNAGRLVATCENTDRIDLGGLPAGSYMLKIHLPGRTSVHRVILE